MPPALEAVCLKAMALGRPTATPSAQALAADVEHWLADEPVTAYREPAGARAAALGAAAPHGGDGGAGRAGPGRGRPRRRAGRRRPRAAEDRRRREGRLDEPRDEKEVERANAAAERDRAVAARKRTREALDAMVSGVTGESLATQQALSAEQKKFLDGVLTYYEQFAAEPGEDRDGRERLAKAHYQLGVIRFRLKQWTESVAVFSRAVELYAALAADFPDVPDYRQDLADSHDFRGRSLYDLGKRAEVEADYRAAVAIWEKLAADFPAVPEYRQDLAESHYDLGRLLRDLGRTDEAEAAYRAALAINEKLAADFPAKPEYRGGLAQSHNSLGVLLRSMGKPREAETAYRASLAIEESLVADFPGTPQYRQRLAAGHGNLGAYTANRAARTHQIRVTRIQKALPAIEKELFAGWIGTAVKLEICRNGRIVVSVQTETGLVDDMRRERRCDVHRKDVGPPHHGSGRSIRPGRNVAVAVIPLIGVIERGLVARVEVVIDLDIDLLAVGIGIGDLLCGTAGAAAAMLQIRVLRQIQTVERAEKVRVRHLSK